MYTSAWAGKRNSAVEYKYRVYPQLCALCVYFSLSIKGGKCKYKCKGESNDITCCKEYIYSYRCYMPVPSVRVKAKILPKL